ncbi:lytic polysaccharide monooxygenase [Enterobacter bugandensis]|uniref:lytic polysaccharide monooxygenase n=1 Tax=Enterobacter bugandensis TaxID=881260 RepID=UPI0015625468|nr:lytic polysaccharide monooxygenase [Enterobacter bugandensis]
MKYPQKSILAIVIGSIAMSTLPGPAFGHGYMISPEARQSKCYSLGSHWNPSAMKDAACKAALDNSPSKQAAFDNRNGYTGFALPPHGLEEAKKAVPDGMLCTGNNPGFAGFTQPRSDWSATTLQPDMHGNVGMTYYYTAKHTPSFIEFYINKKNVDPTKKKLGWGDVELLKTFNIASGDNSDRHTVNVTIPEDRTGKAIIFTRWQRIDPVGEGFYNCSDVIIKARDGSEIPDGGGEEEEGGESGWINKGNFITNAHHPAVGEKVRFRLMGGTRGDNLIDVNLPITAENASGNKWVVELGQMLNREHSNMVQIGQKQGDDTIHFNEQLPRTNQVFVSDKDYGYAIEIVSNAETPVISLDRYTLEPVKTKNTAYAYKVVGSSDKTGITWQWKNVAGDSRITAVTPNQASTDIRIPGGMAAGTQATFELSGTNQKGKTGKATLQVKVVEPHVTANGPTNIATGDSAIFSAKANFNYDVQSWTLLKNKTEVSNGIDQNGKLSTALPAGDYEVVVKVELKSGEREATGTTKLKVISEDVDTGDYETWVKGKTYTAGNLVSWKGVNYIARNWTLAEPGQGADWKLYNNAKAVEWLPAMTYETGNLVTHQGKTWRASQWISPNNIPGQSTLWKQQ